MPIMIPTFANGIFRPFEELSAHRLGLKHKAVSVFIMSGDKVLLQQRTNDKFHATSGLWSNTCCAHPVWEEEPAHCAVRKLDEELGITGLYPQFRGTVEFSADLGNGIHDHELVDVFVGDARLDLEVSPDPSVVEATKWMDYFLLVAEVQENPHLYTPWLHSYLTNFGNMIFGDLASTG